MKLTAKGLIDWVIRFVKGMFIGTGAILPGVSGGALAAVFGIYERIIDFLANIRKNFRANLFFFIPVLLGALFGMVALSAPLHFFLKNDEIQVLWCFVGCIIGTLPSLYKEAGKRGRKPGHIILLVVTAVVFSIGLWAARQYLDITLPQNFATWVLAGLIFALGMVVPGLSPSNFLVYFHLYEPMTDGISKLDFSVVLPLLLGSVICILAFTKLMKKIIEKAYAGVFHFIFGVVIASTIVIVPIDYSGATTGVYIVSAILFLVGLAVGLLMGWLDKTYKPED
jgi:putative membrane protein